MRYVVLGLLLAATVAQAADQTILGSELLVRNPSTPDKRLVVGKAKEVGSPNTIVGDPLTGNPAGALLTVSTAGDNPTEQDFYLFQGTSSVGKPFWSGDAVKGYKYKDAKGDQGPVKQLQIKKSGRGVFSIKFKAQGKLGSLNVLPPDAGTGGCVLLQLGNGGDSYSVRFAPGDALVTNKGALLFKVKNPTSEGTCVPTTTTTTSTTTTTTTTTTTSTTTIATTTTTTTTSTTTTTTIDCTAFAGPSYPPVCGNNDFSFSGNPGDPGGRLVDYFNFSPASGWTQLYWGVWAPYFPTAGLDGIAHALSFGGISGGGSVVTWDGTSGWTDPGDSTFYPSVPIRLTITVTGGGVSWVDSTGISGLDPGLGTGIGAVIDIAPLGTATNYQVNFEFTADIPTDGPTGFIPASTVPGTSGLNTSFSGGFYSQQ